MNCFNKLRSFSKFIILSSSTFEMNDSLIQVILWFTIDRHSSFVKLLLSNFTMQMYKKQQTSSKAASYIAILTSGKICSSFDIYSITILQILPKSIFLISSLSRSLSIELKVMTNSFLTQNISSKLISQFVSFKKSSFYFLQPNIKVFYSYVNSYGIFLFLINLRLFEMLINVDLSLED